MSGHQPDSAANGLPAFGRAVVFGAGGFLGREVVRQLLKGGAEVLGIDTKPWPGELPAGYAHLDSGAGGLADAANFLARECETCSAGQGAPPPGPRLGGAEAGAKDGAAAFFHLAGLADAGLCQKEPELAKKLNVELVALALDALADVHCAFVLPSTGIVYGDRLARPAVEDDPLLPGAEYARGKIEAEGLVRAATERGGKLRGAIARLSNVYGPGGGENTVLGRILGQARRGGPLQVWDEAPVRDFIHVSDAAQGLLRLGLAAQDRGKNPEGCLVANLSSGQGTSVGALIDLCAELFHTSRLPQEREPGPDPKGQAPSSLVLNNARLAALTLWRPGTSLRQGLARSLQPTNAPHTTRTS